MATILTHKLVEEDFAFEEVMDGAEVKIDGFVYGLQVTPLYLLPRFLSKAKDTSSVPPGYSTSVKSTSSSWTQ